MGAWIETPLEMLKRLQAAGRTLMGAWIETFAPYGQGAAQQVAP